MFRYVQKSASPKLIDEAIKQQQTHIRNSSSNQVQKRAKRAVIAINPNAPRTTDEACSEWNRDQRGKKSKQVGAWSLGFGALRPRLGFGALHQGYIGFLCAPLFSVKISMHTFQWTDALKCTYHSLLVW
jgi:hypothetical protein